MRQQVRQVRVILRLCRAQRWADLAGDRIQRALSLLMADRPPRLASRQRLRRGLSANTANHYRTSIKCFCRWVTGQFRARRSPAGALKIYNTAADPRHPRQALSQDELLRLVEAANRAGPIRGVPGYERAMSYLQAATTGVRSAELQSLTRADFNLVEDRPTVTVRAAYAKNGCTRTIELRPDVVVMLRAYFADIGDGRTAFRRPAGKPILGLRADLRAAGIPYQTVEGFADFHALRHTFITHLFDSGATIAEAQALAGHRTAAMTSRYSHSSEPGRRSLIERMPSPPHVARRDDALSPPAPAPAVLHPS